MAQIPVISINANGMETNPGFTYTPSMLVKALQAVVYGDVFMRVLYATRPYEAVPGSANALHEKWKKICVKALSTKSAGMMTFVKNIRGIIHDFDNLERTNVHKPKVGIVGEILVKFSPTANNHIVELLESEGAEAVMPDLMDFLLYCFYNSNFKADNLGMKRSTAHLCNMAISLLEYMRKAARIALEKSTHFTPPSRIKDLAVMANGFVSLGNQTGEGWFLTVRCWSSSRAVSTTSSASSLSAACRTISSEKVSSRSFATRTPRQISSPSTMIRAPVR